MAIMSADLIKKDQATFLELMHLKKKAIGYYNPEKISVVSYFLPSTELTRDSLRKESEICSLRWNRSRWFGQELNFRIG